MFFFYLYYIFCYADEVVMISVAFLVILFSVQKYGTSKVGLAVGPALFIWFCSLAGVGIYNLVKYDTGVLRAFNPVHIFYFFKRNSAKAWLALGGCLLCATGNSRDSESLYYMKALNYYLLTDGFYSNFNSFHAKLSILSWLLTALIGTSGIQSICKH